MINKIYSAIDFCNNLENDNDEEDELEFKPDPN